MYIHPTAQVQLVHTLCRARAGSRLSDSQTNNTICLIQVDDFGSTKITKIESLPPDVSWAQNTYHALVAGALLMQKLKQLLSEIK